MNDVFNVVIALAFFALTTAGMRLLDSR